MYYQCISECSLINQVQIRFRSTCFKLCVCSVNHADDFDAQTVEVKSNKGLFVLIFIEKTLTID